MASCYRSISRPGFNLLKSTFVKPCTRAQSLRSPPSLFSRPWSQMGALQSLLPLHSAISTARLTSCLGADTVGCRSLSQEEKRHEYIIDSRYLCAPMMDDDN